MEGRPHEGAVIRQVADDRMLVQEGHLVLLAAATGHQVADCPQAEGPVREGHGAGLLEAVIWVAAGQGDQALEHADPFDPSLPEHRLGPPVGLRADEGDLPQKPRRAALHRRDFPGVDVLRLRAEAARLALDVDGDLVHPVVEDPHQPPVPADPDLTSQILRRHGVVCLGHLDVAIAVDRPLGLAERGEPPRRQREKRRPLHLRKDLADLPARRAVQTGVGDRGLPLKEVLVLGRQTPERAALQGVVLNVADAALDLPLCLRRRMHRMGTVRHEPFTSATYSIHCAAGSFR